MGLMAAPGSYRPTIGLEIHAELKTRTKMFCDSANDPEAEHPNTNICPICMAHPGTLPVINKEAVRHILRVGSALGGTLADYTEFDRKSYFYPDIPKGYQISQFEHPLVKGGKLKGVEITRVHLEEDTARSTHESGRSLVDFNRAGVPLMELVTEPVIRDAQTAGDFARELQLLLRTLGASDANLEKGEMRVEANVSVSKTDTPSPNYVEIKNINSFRAVERAIEHEIERQIELLESGEQVVKATRGWDENKQETFHQRFKEGSADYRYFPEPDLPKLVISEIAEFSADEMKNSLPELPWDRRARYLELGIKSEDADFLCASAVRGSFFDTVSKELNGDRDLLALAANYIVSDLAGWYAKNGGTEYEHVTPAAFAKLITMTKSGELSSRGAKDVLALLAEKGGDPSEIAAAYGLVQISDPNALRSVLQEVLAANDSVVKEYKAGKEASLQFLIGQGMKASRGAGNPAMIRELLIEEMGK